MRSKQIPQPTYPVPFTDPAEPNLLFVRATGIIRSLPTLA